MTHKFGTMHMLKSKFAILPVLLLVAAALLAFGLAEGPSSWNDPVEQWRLVKFSHRLHVVETGMECADCHAGADTTRTAGDFLLPQKAVCADCHEVEDEQQCSMCHTDAGRLEKYAVPQREVRFNHQAHVVQGMDCLDCHAGVENAEMPSTAFLPAMASCSRCHNGVAQTDACESCHTAVETLLPLSHKQGDWVKAHKRQVRVASMDADCAVCHTDNFCQTCHADANVQFTRSSMVRPLGENRPAPAGSIKLVKQRVHALNFLFFHGIDARGKRSDCYTCHQQQAFCADCHRQEQDAGFASPVPFNHRGPDFIRLGVGSGGGRHANLARKDIESCAACHDVQGSDPACITCHVDRTPGKGNDPRTHARNFMRDSEGDWHGNPASTCFQCHTNTQRAGLGFCGYCHGAK